MLELVASKVVSAVAVLVLAGSALGFFAMERGAMEEARFRDMCEKLGNAIDAISTVNSGMTVNVTSGDEKAGLRLDGSFRGDPYEIELRPDQVLFRQKGLTAVHSFVQGVHVWDLRLFWNGTPYVSAAGLTSLDSERGVFKLWSGEDFVAERAMLVVSGTPAYQTFVHS